MNNKKYISLFFIVLLSVLSNIAFSQNNFAIPFFRNYKSLDYNQESQNYSSVINPKTGIVYFANSSGILEFDNSNWDFIETANTPVIAFNSNGELFYCCANEFGKVNVLTHSAVKLIQFNNVELSNIFIINNKIFLVSDDSLYKVFLKDDKYTCKLIAKNLDFVTKIENNLLLHYPSSGFIVLNENGEKETNLLNNQYANDTIVDLIKHNDELLMRLNNNTFVSISFKNGISSRKILTQADKYIEEYIYSCMASLPNGDLLVGTKQRGIVCIDKRGYCKYLLNLSFDFSDNLIHNIAVDDKNDVAWIATNNGISVVDISNDIFSYTNNHGLIGNILTIYKDDNLFYVGTSVGVYYYDNAIKTAGTLDAKIFVNIESIKAKCWQIIKIKNDIYAVTDKGFYCIEKNTAKLIIPANFKVISKLKEDFYIIAGKSGAYLLNFTNNTLEKTLINNFPLDVRTFAYDKNSIWLGSDNRKLYYIKDKNSLTSELKIVDTTNILPPCVNWVDVYNAKNTVLFSTNCNVFSFSKKTNTLKHEASFFSENQKQFYYPIYVDSDENVWFANNCYNDNKQRGLSVLKKINNGFVLEELEKLSVLKNYNIESLYVGKDGTLMAGTTEGLFSCSNIFNEKKTSDFRCFLKTIRIKNHLADSIIHFGYEDTIVKITLNVSRNTSISFDFASNFYSTSRDNVEYQYMLKNRGEKSNFSQWTDFTTKEYISLEGGNYQFILRAKDIYGNTSKSYICNLELIKKKSVFVHPLMIILYILILISVVFFIISFILRKNKHEKLILASKVLEQTREISQQKEKIERIMKQWLPAKEIKSEEDYKNKNFESVTVIFSDIAGFSKIINISNQEQVLERLNFIFNKFDDIIRKYHITKIKTIGDAYMCVSGIERQDNTHCIMAILAVFDMQRFLQKNNAENSIKMEMRFGIHSGQVIAGVVGKNKLEYDVWGDTVNIANRMQSNGVVNNLNMSPQSYELSKYFFDFEYRGKIAVKFIGDVSMYIAKNIKSSLTDDGIHPNHNFNVKLQFLKFKIIEEKILAKLHSGLAPNLYYHNVSHTIDVVYSVENIGRKENVSEEEMLLLKCAALFHDTGFLVCYDGHEEESAKMADYYLRKYDFSESQIETVKRLIRATKSTSSPSDLLEGIICDADLNYLVRPDFIPISESLFREAFERNKVTSKEKWYKKQYDFILNHIYYTKTVQSKNINKERLLEELKSFI